MEHHFTAVGRGGGWGVLPELVQDVELYQLEIVKLGFTDSLGGLDSLHWSSLWWEVSGWCGLGFSSWGHSLCIFPSELEGHLPVPSGQDKCCLSQCCFSLQAKHLCQVPSLLEGPWKGTERVHVSWGLVHKWGKFGQYTNLSRSKEARLSVWSSMFLHTAMVMNFLSWQKGQDSMYKQLTGAFSSGWWGTPSEKGWGVTRATAHPHLKESADVAGHWF